MLYYLIFGQEVSLNRCKTIYTKKHSIPQFDQKLKNGEAAHYSMREIAVETQKAGQRPPALYGVVILNKLCISALIL